MVNGKAHCDELILFYISWNKGASPMMQPMLTVWDLARFIYFLIPFYKHVFFVCCFAESLNVISRRNAENNVVIVQVFFKIKVVP